MNKVKHGLRNQARFSGVTLVELLVVVGLVSVLAAVVLPSIKNVLTDRKGSQAAIVVKNFIEAARARAIGKNRSVAVVLERLSSRADAPGGPSLTADAVASDSNFLPYNTCIKLSLAEEPIPFTNGQLTLGADSKCRMMSRAPIRLDSSSNPIPPIDGLSFSAVPIPMGIYTGVNALADLDQTSQFEARIFSVAVVTTNVAYPLVGGYPQEVGGAALAPLAEYLVAGNEISFGTSGKRFTITAPRSPIPHVASLANVDAQGVSRLWFAIDNERGLDSVGERALSPYVEFQVPPALQPLLPTSSSPGAYIPGTQFSEFRVYPRPKPIYTQTVQLPRGMCIDLSLSGFGNDRVRDTLIAASPNDEPITALATAVNPSPLSDYRVRFASDWIGNGTIPAPNELRPIYLVFSADGSFSRVIVNERGVGNSIAGNSIRVDAVEDVFLHIGKIDQVRFPLRTPSVNRTLREVITDETSGLKNNLFDLSSYVVRISPKSGAVSASPVVGYETQVIARGLDPTKLTLGDVIELTRSGAYGSSATAQ